jgi:hypothetical protein
MSTSSNGFQVKGYTISEDLFMKGYVDSLGPCACSSSCCSGGVYADIKERDIIMAHKDEIKAQMDETQVTDDTRWFDAEEVEHHDFPSGKCIGTQEINGKCAFLNKRGWCSIQMASVAAGKHKWDMKPLYCVLFPVEISDKVVGFDDLLQGERHCCSIGDEFQTPLFKACQEELEYLLGKDGFAEVEQEYARRKADLNTTTSQG